MDDATKKIIRRLYDEVVSEMQRGPEVTPQAAMTAVARRWYNHNAGPFNILLELFEQNGKEPVIWREVKTKRGIREKVVTYELLPFDELPLGIDRFGDGDTFFDLFDHPDAGIRVDATSI